MHAVNFNIIKTKVVSKFSNTFKISLRMSLISSRIKSKKVKIKGIRSGDLAGHPVNHPTYPSVRYLNNHVLSVHNVVVHRPVDTVLSIRQNMINCLKFWGTKMRNQERSQTRVHIVIFIIQRLLWGNHVGSSGRLNSRYRG